MCVWKVYDWNLKLLYSPYSLTFLYTFGHGCDLVLAINTCRLSIQSCTGSHHLTSDALYLFVQPPCLLSWLPHVVCI